LKKLSDKYEARIGTYLEDYQIEVEVSDAPPFVESMTIDSSDARDPCYKMLTWSSRQKEPKYTPGA
jgi:hypothetical protein